MPDQRTKIMGVLNVTPDSFSDGGKWLDPSRAISHGEEMLADGADLLDIGGESTRPGARRISEEEELARILPVITGLIDGGATLSVDTTRASVAREALAAGVHIINDVSGGKSDPEMPTLIAETGCTYILSHWRGPSDVMNSLATYNNVFQEVSTELLEQVRRVLQAGVKPEQIIIDPGLGFAKNGPANWEILAQLKELMLLGYPVLLGASRKRFLGELSTAHHQTPVQRDQATAAITAIAAYHGVWGVRVHDVSPSVDAIAVAQAMRTAKTKAKEDQ